MPNASISCRETQANARRGARASRLEPIVRQHLHAAATAND